jgi:P-type Cu+ transporter
MVGTGIAASFGVLIKGGDVLERIKSITTVVFDKTGTLTSGAPIVKDFIDLHQTFKFELPQNQQNVTYKDLLELTYLCESESEHPLAKAIVEKVKQERQDHESTYILTDFKNINGEGVTVKISVHRPLDPNMLSIPMGTPSKRLGEKAGEFRVHCGNDKLMDRY